MSQPIIVLGDSTSHGGKVIGASSFSDTHGKGWARVGDMVSCPRCKGVFPISQGDSSLTDDGKAVAYHGCKTACGATLISSQSFTTTDPSGGASAGADAAANKNNAANLGSIGAGMVAGYSDEPVDVVSQRFKGRFQVLDQTSGEPLAQQQVRVRSTSGQYLTGTTDAEGYTQWVERDATENLAFDLIEQQT